MNNNIGVFRGRTLIQSRGTIGGSRQVFVPLEGNKDDLVFPPIGGKIINPFKGAAKMFAGDLCEYQPNENGENPVIVLLKTYKVVSASGTTVNILNDGYSHIPFVGDKLGVAPDTIGDTGTASVITAVTNSVVSGKKVWACTFAETIDASAADVLVEYDSDDNMLVKNINSVIDCDCDFLYEPAIGDEDFDNARYFYAPSLRGTMFISKMSAMPECVKNVNFCRVNGWFRVDAFSQPIPQPDSQPAS